MKAERRPLPFRPSLPDQTALSLVSIDRSSPTPLDGRSGQPSCSIDSERTYIGLKPQFEQEQPVKKTAKCALPSPRLTALVAAITSGAIGSLYGKSRIQLVL